MISNRFDLVLIFGIFLIRGIPAPAQESGFEWPELLA